MKKIPVEKAVGMVLCHDITQIIPGQFKGRAFKKGHIIQKEDIEKFLELGKEQIYVWEPKAGEIHENEAALRIAGTISGENIIYDEPIEGKSTLKSKVKGVLKIESSLLKDINSIENLGLKRGKVFAVKNYKKMKAAIITNGNEIYKNRIQDKFGPIMKEKLNYFRAEYLGQTICPDDRDEIKKTIFHYRKKEADLIILTGGMSVDPDDQTPGAIKKSGAKVVTYGVPVQPGNMFMMAYLGETVLLGVPGCAMYYKTTILDVVLPRIFIGEILTKVYFVRMGEGGFCLNCEVCHYPNCFFCR